MLKAIRAKLAAWIAPPISAPDPLPRRPVSRVRHKSSWTGNGSRTEADILKLFTSHDVRLTRKQINQRLDVTTSAMVLPRMVERGLLVVDGEFVPYVYRLGSSVKEAAAGPGGSGAAIPTPQAPRDAMASRCVAPTKPSERSESSHPPSESEWRIEVIRESDGRFGAEITSGDGKIGGWAGYANSPVGALADACAELIKIAEDRTVEESAPDPARILNTDQGTSLGSAPALSSSSSPSRSDTP
jgi:hypothetical protein